MVPGADAAAVPQPDRVSDDLVELLTVTQRRLARGVAAALAYRLPDPDDGRKVVVHLSEPGRTRLSRLEAMVQAHESARANSLGGDRVATLVRAPGNLANAKN